MVLDLYLIDSLERYLQRYGRSIWQRTKVSEGVSDDPKDWTRDEIGSRIQEAYLDAWSQRETWESSSLDSVEEFIQANSYPVVVRGTLRDALVYGWADFLRNTQFWTPLQFSEVAELSRSQLIEVGATTSTTAPGAVDAHPLLQLAALLADHEAWHRTAGRWEAAFEARRERLRLLHQALTSPPDRQAIVRQLQSSLNDLDSDLPWWSMGAYTLAGMHQIADEPWDLQKARDIARRGEQIHPGSPGAEYCRHLVETLETPALRVAAMTVDGPGKRSIRVSYKNLPRLHFRAYPGNPAAHLRDATRPSYSQSLSQTWPWELTDEPVAQWSVDLPPTPDLREHDLYVTPPLGESGPYVVVASTDPDFAQTEHQLAAFPLLISDLLLIYRQEGSRLQVTTVSGSLGSPLSGVPVTLHVFQRGSYVEAGTVKSDADGHLSFALEPSDSRRFYSLHSRANGQEAWVTGSYFLPIETFDANRDDEFDWGDSYWDDSDEFLEVLVFTDRSVYRPGQTVHWKILPFVADESKPSLPLTELSITVSLMSEDYDEVARVETKTNAFGTAAGSFVIPRGYALGEWSIEIEDEPWGFLRVEEYKRPTFEVTIDAAPRALRLDEAGTLAGAARYFHGSPVAGGEVRWRVLEAYYDYRGHGDQVIASGMTTTDDRGRYSFDFTPTSKAIAQNLSDELPSTSFDVSVEVVDPGGETRQTERRFVIGFETLEPTLESADNFFVVGEGGQLTIHRRDLDGEPRPGEGHWKLFALVPPDHPIMPSERRRDPPALSYFTEGDLLNPRWSMDSWPPIEAIDALADWSTEAEPLATGTTRTPADTAEVLSLPEDLVAGAYRLVYHTFDGQLPAESALSFLVVEDGMTNLPLPLLLLPQRTGVEVGGTARILVHSGFLGHTFDFSIYQSDQLRERTQIVSDGRVRLLDVPVTPEDQGGYGLELRLIRDHQQLDLRRLLVVPWKEKTLNLEWGTMRDFLSPGNRETWSLTVRDGNGQPLGRGEAEVLAFMYDRSLDLFQPHELPSFRELHPGRSLWEPPESALDVSSVTPRFNSHPLLPTHHLEGDHLRRGRLLAPIQDLENRMVASANGFEEVIIVTGEMPRTEIVRSQTAAAIQAINEAATSPSFQTDPPSLPAAISPLRRNFDETAFWEPNLLTNSKGQISIDFTVPDSMTEWKVWVFASTQDLSLGFASTEIHTIKQVIVRPYLPRFLRAGDSARLRVRVDNVSDSSLTGTLDFEIFDPTSDDESADPELLADFGLTPSDVSGLPFSIKGGGSQVLAIPLTTPNRSGEVGVRITARAGDYRDGEVHSLPILPSRLHLTQSRFATLREEDTAVLSFDDLSSDDDPTRRSEQLVVTLDGQLFYQVLDALPYLVEYPYECTEQTLNRFLSSGIVHSVFDQYPAVAEMAKSLSERETQWESWDHDDPNRAMTLAESPWRLVAEGGRTESLTRVLDPEVAETTQREALEKLAKAQSDDGGFPWWAGGESSTYSTLYLLHGFARAQEFGIEVPHELSEGAWKFLHSRFEDARLSSTGSVGSVDFRAQSITFLNYILSSYELAADPPEGIPFTPSQREELLEISMQHWRDHSRYSKAMLALTLHRRGRHDDAQRMLKSIFATSKTTDADGTYWQPEDRAWLWQNDTVEGHAFLLNALLEIDPDNPRRHGLVQWLLIQRQLGHWKSTRATAEVIYALVHYLDHEKALGVREAATVQIADQQREFVFEPEEYTGKDNRWVIPGAEVTSAMGAIEVSKETPGFLFASATWQFSTEELPKEASGDLFHVERTFFRRIRSGQEWTLEPLTDGVLVTPGDVVEV
ncbi:MAG: hypothetical protein K8J08_11720, partial [Thermoanaerobaculia bacterium]|nr:hypothetical protein [Thermoanaerobaculia bacterium]